MGKQLLNQDPPPRITFGDNLKQSKSNVYSIVYTVNEVVSLIYNNCSEISVIQLGGVFFTRCLPIAFTQETMFVHVYDREFFSPNCSKFAVECNRNSKVSQNVKNLFFFGKDRWIFRKKLEFFRNRQKWKTFCRMHLICEVFRLKFRKYLKLEKFEIMMKKLKKTLSFFKKAF